jgi:hypothetical protein
MADPIDIGDVDTNRWPTTNSPPDELTMQALLVSISKRIGSMPIDYSGAVGQLVVVAADGSGPKVLEDSGVGAIDLAGAAVRNGKTDLVTITGSGLLTDSAHRGRDLLFTGSSSITLTINLDSAGLLGVTSGFNCHVYRAYDGGSVGQLHLALGPGITLQRPDGALGVPAGNGIALKLVGARLFVGNSVA